MTVAISSKEILLGTVEAATLLGLEPNTVAQYVRRKQLVPISRMGRAYVFTKSEVERFKIEKRSPGNPTFVKAAEKKAKAKPRHRKASKTVA